MINLALYDNCVLYCIIKSALHLMKISCRFSVKDSFYPDSDAFGCAICDRALKVHKIENFFDSYFGICIISLLVMHK